MSEQKMWLDHPVYRLYRDEDGYWEVALLLPTSQTPEIFPGEETHGDQAERWPAPRFQQEVARRTTHSPAMLAMLADNWTGKDLRGWHVYAFIVRPMMGIRIEGTVYLKGNGARYRDAWIISDYVVAEQPLDAKTIEHYSLVEISHPSHAKHTAD